MKNIDTIVKNEFYRSNFVAVDLLEFHLPGTPLYLSNGAINIVWDSPTAPTAGANTYTAQGDFLGFTGLTEDFDIRVGRFAVALNGVGNNYVADLIGPDITGKVNYEGARVLVYKAFLSIQTLQIIGTPLLMFDGVVYNVNISESSRSCNITIECATLFSDFDRTAGRKTNNGSNWLFQGSNYDTCMEQSGYVGNTEYKWGKA